MDLEEVEALKGCSVTIPTIQVSLASTLQLCNPLTSSMSDLKPLSKEAIPAALEKAMRYRLLNEPAEAESICLDVLKADPDNQEAIITLLLALTDRFTKGYGVSDTQIKRLIASVHNEYE